MPIPSSACPPRKAKTAQGPKSRNIVDVEKLKSGNENGEPGIEKKNVKFLFGLLEQASNEREHLMKQLAEKNETIEVISQQRQLEENSFRKVLTSERKKFDKKILDARNMLQRREDILRLWVAMGTSSTVMTKDEDSEEHREMIRLLKRTSKIVPDAIDASQKMKLNIVSNGDGNDENEEAVDDIKLYDDEEDDEEEHEEREEETEQQKEEDVVGNSIGGLTMKGSIVMQSKNDSHVHSRVDSRLNMGSGILEDTSVDKEFENDSLQFQTMSNISAHGGSSVCKPVPGSSSAGMSSSYHEQSRSAVKQPSANKRFESVSLDFSDTSSKKYWWDHLVEDTGEDTKEKKDTDLVLGSRLDKGDRPRGYDNNDDDFEEDAGNEDDKNDGDNGEREGGSVMSLSSNDFKFSTTSNIP